MGEGSDSDGYEKEETVRREGGELARVTNEEFGAGKSH